MAEQRSFVCPETDAPCENRTCRLLDGHVACALETDSRRRMQATAGAREVERLMRQRAADERLVQTIERDSATGQLLLPYIEEEWVAARRRLSGVGRDST